MQKKPFIALALGSGAAKGWAHIGVLQFLAEKNIKPDLICGTSIGAVAGACFSAGKLEALEEFALSLTKRRMLRYMDFSFGGGIISGDQIVKVLEKNLGELKFEDLSTKFVAIATELSTGHEIWMREGELIPALRASFAIPGVFSPHKYDQRWLTDGGLVNPVPVSVCRAFGARIVIAINLNAGITMQSSASAQLQNLNGPKQIETLIHSVRNDLRNNDDKAPSLSDVTMTSINIMQDRIARMRMASDPADALITPKIDHIGSFDFDRGEELIKLGYDAAKKSLPNILTAIQQVGS